MMVTVRGRSHHVLESRVGWPGLGHWDNATPQGAGNGSWGALGARGPRRLRLAADRETGLTAGGRDRGGRLGTERAGSLRRGAGRACRGAALVDLLRAGGGRDRHVDAAV